MIYNIEHIGSFIEAALDKKRMPNDQEFIYSEPVNRACPENTALVALALTAAKEPQKHQELFAIMPARFQTTFNRFSQKTIHNIVACVQ